MVPSSREDFKKVCLRQLGYGATRVNVTPEQIDDCVDIALKKFADYHFDAAETVYYKYVVEEGNRPDKVYTVTVLEGGTGYANNEPVSVTDAKGTGAAGYVTTDPSGSVLSVTLTDHGSAYVSPSATVVTSAGTGASIVPELGGWVPLPENVLGVVDLFDIGSETGVNNIFNIRYQIAMNDLYTLTSVSMIPYYMAMTHVQFLEQMLVGKKPLRYNRYKNRLYVDMDWTVAPTGSVICAKAYEVIDPDVYTKVWSDSWLQRYATQLIKRVYGANLSKYSTLPGPGGVRFNADKIYDDAVASIEKLEYELVNSWSLPAIDAIG